MPSLVPNDIDDIHAEKYRAQLDSLGQDTRFISNRELVKRLGDSIKNSGRTNDDIVRTYGEGFLNKYLDEINKPVEGQGVIGDAMASFRRQAIGLGEIGMGGVGLAADAFGLDSVRDAAMNKAAEFGALSAQGPQPTIDSYTNVRFDNPGEVARYTANLIGGAAPSILESAASFGAGGVVGVAGRSVLKSKLKKELAGETADRIEEIARKKAFQTGALSGVATSSALMGTGEVYSELYPYTQLDPSDEEYMDPDTVRKVSFVGGAMVAGLDFASAGIQLNKLLNIGDEASEFYLRRLIANLPEGVILEGATEAAQEFIIMASEKYIRQEDHLTDAEIERMIDAGIMGAVGGTQFASISALRSPPSDPRDVSDQDKPTMDMSERPDQEALLTGDKDPLAEELQLKVGEEVAEPLDGTTGVIKDIQNGVATIESTTTDQDGVETTVEKEVPLAHLAPITEKPKVEPDKVKEEKKSDTEKLTNPTPLKEEPSSPSTEAKNAVYEPPSDEYGTRVSARKVSGVSPTDKLNANEVYGALSNAMQDPDSKIRRKDTFSGWIERLKDEGKITEDVYNKAMSSDRSALKVLRKAGLLGNNYNWQEETAYDQLLQEELNQSRENKAIARRLKEREDNMFEVGDVVRRTNAQKAITSPNYFTITELQDDGFVKVDMFSDEELTDKIGSQVIDPKLLKKPAFKKKRVVDDEGNVKQTEFELIEDSLTTLPDDIDFSKDVRFNLFSRKTDKRSKSPVTIKNVSSLADIARQLKSGDKIRNSLKKNYGYVTVVNSQGEEVNVTMEADFVDGTLFFTLGGQVIDMVKVPLKETFGDNINSLPDDLKIDFVNFDELLTNQVEKKEINTLKENVVQFKGRAHGNAFAIYRRMPAGAMPSGSFRVVSTKKNGSKLTSYDTISGKFKTAEDWVSADYELVGFITASEKYGEVIDVYYENAEALHKDLLRGGYVRDEMVGGLPEEVPFLTYEVGLNKEAQKLSTNARSIMRKIRQRQRELAIENPGEDVSNIIKSDDVSIKLFKDLKAQEARIERLQGQDKYLGRGEFKRTTFSDQKELSVLKDVLSDNYSGWAKLVEELDRYTEYQELRRAKRQKTLTKEASNKYEQLKAYVGERNIVDYLREFHFTDENLAKFFSAIEDFVTNKNFARVNTPFANKILEIHNEDKRWRNVNIKEITAEQIDEMRSNPDSVATTTQVLQYLFVKNGIMLDEANNILKQVMGAGIANQAVGATKRAKGQEAKDKEFLDINKDNPEEIFRDTKVLPPRLANITPARVKSLRDPKISKALKEFSELPGMANLYRDVLKNYITPNSVENSNFASDLDDWDAESLNAVSNQNLDARSYYQAAIPYRPDLVTGRVEPMRQMPVNKELIEKDEEYSRSLDYDVAAPRENPLVTKGHQDLVVLAQGAIKRFTDGGDIDGSFNGKLALKEVIKKVKPSYENGDALTFWASMLRGSSALDNIRVRFEPWDQFYKRARVTKHGITTGVYLPSDNEIVITDTFYTDPKKRITADETLANLIVHELAHVPVRLGMEVAYAHDAKDENMIRELADLKLGVDAEALTKIYRDVRDTIIPYLKEVNKEYGINPREYALSSVEEFFAELASNYELRHLLKKARLTPELQKKLGMPTKNPFKTVWQWIRRVIARIIGVEYNLLGTADNYLKSVIKIAQPMGKFMGQLPFDEKERKMQMMFDFDKKVEEAPSDQPSFWRMFRINPKSPRVYDQVADVLIYTGDPNMDPQTALDYGPRLGLDVARLRQAMERAQARHRRKNRYSQVNIPEADVTPPSPQEKPKYNTDPDGAALVMHESSIASNNETLKELTKVYTMLERKNALPDQFKGEKGPQEFLKKFAPKVKGNIQVHADRLGITKEEASKIDIGNRGMNRAGRDRALIDSVQYLSKLREKARIKKAEIAENVDIAKSAVATFERLYADAVKGRLTPPQELADALADKITNQMNLPQMQKLFESMKESQDITIADMKAVRERPDLKARVRDAMDAIVEMSDSVELMTKKEIMERIKTSLDPRLTWLKQNEYALYSFADRSVHSRGIYGLYRITKDAPSEQKKKFLKDVGAIATAKTEKAVDDALNDAKTKGRIGTHLEKIAAAKRKALKVEASYKNELEMSRVYDAIDGEILAREKRFRTALGELEPVDIRHGVNMLVMERKKDKNGNIITSGRLADQWELNEFRVRYQGGKLADRDAFVKANVQTMEFLRDENAKKEFGHEPWFDIMREQSNRAMNEPVGDQYFTIRKQAWMAGIESLNARLNRLGYEGKKLAGMLARTSALFRDLNSDVQYHAKRWNVAYLNLMDKLKIPGKKLFTTFYQEMWWWMDQHPEYIDNETDAVNELWKHLKEKGNIADKSVLTAEAKKAMVTLIRRTIDARDYEAGYNFNTLGNRIKDDFKVQSLVSGEMGDFYRRPVDLGYATIPRVLNESAIADAMIILKKKTKNDQNEFKGGWVPSKSSEIGVYQQIKEVGGKLDEETMKQQLSRLFNDEVVDRWVSNYLKGENRKSQFYGPDELEVGNSFINAVWADAQREASGTEAFFLFLDKVYDHYVSTGALTETVSTPEGMVDEISVSRSEWYWNMTKQFQRRFDTMHTAYKEIMSQNDGNKVQNMLMNSPRSLDSRSLAATLPKEYFYYDSYDEITSAVRLQMMIASSVFGRGGTNANTLKGQADERWAHDRQVFLKLIEGATGAKPNGVLSDYSKDVRNRVYDALRQRPDITNGRGVKETFEDLFANAAAHGEMEVIFDHLNKYYGSGNVAGPFRDANLPLEILGLQSLSVLNNPKSAFWQGLSLTEFPMAFHGMNGMALKATGKGFMTFIDQTFGGMLEAMGVNMGRTHRYADYLANTHFRNSEADLTYKEYTSQVGTAGEMSNWGMDSESAKRGVRFMKKMAMHNRKDKKKGTRSPIDWTTPLIGLFPYINSNINHGAGVGAIFAVESEVLKIAKVIEQQGLKNYHNFTAEELGLGAGVAEFFIGEKDGYNQMNNLLESVGLPNLSRLAFDFVQRKESDPNTPVIEKQTGLLINQMAMNEVTGEGFNAKPAALYTHPMWKYFGIFLGWPLWKMARDNRVIQGNSNYVFGKDARTDRATWMAFLKYLSMVSAVYAPAGLAFAMLVDWYDDEILEKPNNLPPVSPWALMPVLGPFMAAHTDPNFSIYSITSRLAKSGVPYGMGMDLANSVFSKGDPYGSSKEFSLDSRIFAWSMIKNIYDAMGNWMHQGEIDYQNVTRPIMYGLGGNSVIQFMDATTAMFDIDSTERRMADYIGARNIIKKYAWGLGLDLRPPAKGYGRPTSMSINVRQMERAAYNYDTVEFREAYQDALEAAREDGEQNPEKAIRDRFKRRLVLYNITDGKITDEQLERMFELMDEEERALIEGYLRAHEQYLQMIEVSVPTKKDAAAQMFYNYGITTGGYAPRKDPRLFALGYY